MKEKDDTVQTTIEGDVYYNAVCKWCGKPFHKKANKSQYCSKECAMNKTRENKAKYQMKRRLQAKHKTLVLPEHKKYGLGSYGTSSTKHPKDTFKEEYAHIQKELRRLGLKKK